MNNTLPRGIRNNNPLNIRIGNRWKGEVAEPTDKEFEQFTSMFYGLRAAFILLHRYITRYHLTTVQDIVCRWAPPSENNSSKYAATVARKMGIGIFDRIDFDDADIMCDLAEAMCLVECGCTVDRALIEQAYSHVKLEKS